MANNVNPIMQRLTSRNASLRFLISAVIGLVLLSSVFSYIRFQSSPGGSDDNVSALGLLIFWLSNGSALLFSGPIAAFISARDAQNEMYELVRTTPLTNLNLINGYFFATLHRLRLLIVPAVGFSPFFLQHMIRWKLSIINCTYVYNSPCRNMPDPLQTEWSLWALMLIEFAVGLWGATLLGIALGVGLGLLWRKVILVGVVALAFTAILWVAFGSAFSLLSSVNTQWLPIDGPNITVLTFYMITPYLLCLGVLAFANYKVRKV